ncbi:MAG: SNF2 helicase associated domain-containing protein [Eubacteriales bacterium]|nr:SNF2 helicase associated domain-containing protein [Eubacteriales bacterium]
MMTKSYIRRMAGNTSYERGELIYQAKRILSFQLEEQKDDIDYITAEVQGSGRKKYEVVLACDKASNQMKKAYCSCPAFYSYSGICKHCAAVALRYMEEKEKELKQRQMEEQNPALQMQRALGIEGTDAKVSRKMQRKKVISPTTPAMQRLLAAKVNRRISDIQNQVRGAVRLEPYLTCDRSSLSLEFKIGITQKYVLKDVYAFASRVEKQEEFSYGQRLKFLHSMEAFDEDSVPVVRFITNWVNQTRMRRRPSGGYGYGSYSGYSSYSQNTRCISLTTQELEEFLESMGHREFIGDIENQGQEKWHVTDEKLPRTMTLTGKQNGVELEINQMLGYEGNRYCIYFDKGRIYLVPKNELEPIYDFLKYMSEIRDKKMFVGTQDIPLFCRELLPVFEQHYKCVRRRFDPASYGLETAAFEIYLDAPQKDYITCKVLAVYGDKKYNVYSKEKADFTRDIVRETEVGKLAGAYCNAYDDREQVMVLADDEDKLYELFVYGIPAMHRLGEVFVSDSLKRMGMLSSPRVSVGLAVNGDWLELKMTSQEMSRESLMEILSRYNPRKKYYRLKNGEFVNMEDEGISTLLELKKGLNLSASQLGQEVISVPKYRALYLDGELRKRSSVPVSRNKEFRALIRNMKTVEDNDFELPSELEGILREYQKRGFLWIKTLCHNGFGGILADDMGLGKTLQVIAFLLSEYKEAKPGDNRRTLIICPTSLVFNWKSEFERFAPSLPVRMITGTAAERKKLLLDVKEREILLTSYDLLKRDLEYYKGFSFFCQIIDEAQYIKSHNTQATKAVKQIQSVFRMALTGTPIENRLSELWSIFDYLMPGFLYTYQKFREDIESPAVQGEKEEALSLLQRMIRPFVLRRLKKEVLTDLPDKLEECVYARMEGEQQSLYDAHVQRLRILLDKNTEEEFNKSKLQILAELTKLRQLCCDPSLLYEGYKGGSSKTEVCVDLIKNAISAGHKILLFSQFTTMLQRLEERLMEEKISYYSLTGSTTKEKRRELVEAFQTDDTQVFCISLKAGGTGLNLTAADIVIHYDPWWNVAVQNQATDRAHRIGQENVVSVYKLIAKGSIEESITNLQDRKSQLADQVLGGEGMNSGSFTKEELLELLR